MDGFDFDWLLTWFVGVPATATRVVISLRHYGNHFFRLSTFHFSKNPRNIPSELYRNQKKRNKNKCKKHKWNHIIYTKQSM